MSATDYTVQAPSLTLGGRFAALARNRRFIRTLLSLLGAAAFIGFWAYLSAYIFATYVLPSPWDVATRMWELLRDGTVWKAFSNSLLKTMWGFGAAYLIGVPMGLLMGRYRYANAFFHDFVYLLANVPLIVYAVLALVLFGISPIGPAFVVMLLVLPSAAINTAAGVRSADEGLLAMSRAFCRSTATVRLNVILPAVLPFLLAAGRVSFADSWKLEALSETFGGSGAGVGFELKKSFELFSVVDALAWMMFFVVFIILIERVLLLPAERRIFAWRNPGSDEDLAR